MSYDPVLINSLRKKAAHWASTVEALMEHVSLYKTMARKARKRSGWLVRTQLFRENIGDQDMARAMATMYATLLAAEIAYQEHMANRAWLDSVDEQVAT